MPNEKVLVTGGSGFIGSNLVRRLVQKGFTTAVFDNNFRGSMDRLADIKDQLTLIEGDIRKLNDVQQACKGFNVIFHLAFINGTKFFYEQPRLVLDVGVKGAINSLETAITNNVKQFILASSSEVYQEPTHVPTTEKERIFIPDIRNPRYSYGGGKIISELLTLNYLRDTQIRHQIFRPHNIFGPQMGFEHVIPELVKKIGDRTDGFKESTGSISIQGTGEETRAFCYVEDAVDQLMMVFEKGKSGEIYHIGMNQEITISQLVNDIAEVLELHIDIIPGQRRKGGTTRRCPCIEKLKAIGYNPNNHYKSGLKRTVEWYKNFYLKEIPVGI